MDSHYYTHTDQQLLELLNTGDQSAFAEIYRRYFDLLFIHADTRLQDKDQASDTVQDVFIRLWEKRVNLTISTSLSGYLYRAVRNQIFDTIKHEKVADKYIDSFYAASQHSPLFADHLIREKQFAQMIEDEIAALPKRMREVFELRRNENLSNKEIARRMDITESTVADQMKKALKTLRIRIGLLLIFATLIDKNL